MQIFQHQDLMTMTKSKLFRAQALQCRSEQQLGPASLAFSSGVRGLVCLFAILALLGCGFAIWGSHTRRTTVHGLIQPVSGILPVYATQSGTIRSSHVREGSLVRRGDPLFILSNQQFSHQEARQKNLIDSIRASQDSLIRSRKLSQSLARLKTAETTQQLALLQQHIQRASRQHTRLQQRLQLSQKNLAVHRQLSATGAESALTLRQKQTELLDVEHRISAQRQALDTLLREQVKLSAELLALPLQLAETEAGLSRKMQALDQARLEVETRQESAILAPGAGMITAISVSPGLYVTTQQPLALLIPQQAKLEAHLYAPSKAIGFIRSGCRVKLRVDAFPYQKFGHLEGTVTEITHSAMLHSERPLLPAMNEPHYRIRVTLNQQGMRIHGQLTALRPLMSVSGDIMLETRRLYAWLLEPLYSISGKW
jgi:membrane fusion protein